MEETYDLIFLDSFSHDNSEDLNLDLVQFSNSVIIQEVRIIPNGLKVLVEFPGKVTYGCTTPSSFKVEFYVNNLNKPNASTFEKIGILDYHENGEYVIKSDQKKLTDGLIIKGWYQNITLAIYGTLTSLNQSTSSPPPTSAIKAKQQVVCQSVQSSSPKDIPLEHKGAVKDPRDNHDRLEGVFKMPEKKDKVSRKTNAAAENNIRGKKRELVGDGIGVQHKKSKSSSPNIYFDDEEDVTEPGEIAEGCDVVDENMDIYGALSDGEIPENDGEYSQVSSDENNLQYVGCLPQEAELGDWDGVDDGTWTYGSISSFNPYQCELASLETFADPTLTEFEKEKLKLLSSEVVLDEVEDEQMPASSLFILNFVKHLKQGAQHESSSFVESLESLPSHFLPGLVFISQVKKLKENVEYLIDWACDNLENGLRAISFKNFTIKYLKAIIKLLGCLCTCDSHIAGITMERNVQQKLLNAYDDMSPSISLQSLILASIDQSIRFKEGLDAFIGRQSTHSDRKAEACSQTPYQRMVGILLNKQRKILSLRIQSILKKVHIYEVLSKLYKNVLNLQNKSAIEEFSNNTTTTTNNNNNNANVVSEDGDKLDEVGSDCLSSDTKQAEKNVVLTSSSLEKKDSNNSDNTIDDEMRLMKTNDDEISDEVMMIVACLDEVHTVLQNYHQLAQPERFVIYNRQNALDSLCALLHIFDTCNLVECIFVLLSSPLTNNNPSIFMSLKNVLTSLTTLHQGLLFLTFKSEATNGILRILLQTSDYCQDDERELNAANQLGLFMVYHLQTIQYIDQLNEYHIKASLCEDQNVNDTAILAVMLNLYSMTFTFQGKEALVHVFTSNDNINTLMSFIYTDSEDNEKKHSPVCISYVLSIILIIVQHTDEVEWLLTNCKTLLSVIERELKSGKADDQVKELYDWLSPLKIIGPQTPTRENSQTLALELLTALRQHVEDMQDVPKSVVTILRVLKHLSIQSNDYEQVDKFRAIQYKVVLNSLFGANCLSLFGNILLKVKNLLLLPWQLGFSMTPTRKWLMLSVVQPILLMMRALLTQLISLRDTKFADLSALAGLFGIHTVMCSTSQTGVLPPELQKIQNLIVDILMAFTQPTIVDSMNEVGSNGLWSKMIGEVLKYTQSLPCTFLSGLILISELLPLPLPLQVKQEISLKQVDEVLLMRKRWAVQLLAHASVLHQIIRVLSATTIQPLNQLLRRVCWQIADLSAATAVIVVSSLLDILKESMDPSMDHTASVKDASDKTATTTNVKCEQSEYQASPRTYRILSLISFLVSQPAIKCSFLSHLKSNDASERYGNVIERMTSLLNVVSDQFAHLQAQEAILTIFQSLCDYEISLIMDSELKLSNCLPSKEHISLICLALLKHIGNRDHKFSTILLSLRTLSLLLDHDHGFYFVKRAMEEVSTCFINLFMHINATFSKDSSDCMATLSSAADFLQYLTTLPPTQPLQQLTCNAANDENVNSENKMVVETGYKPLRTYRMSADEVRKVLGWPSSGADDDVGMTNHPLNDLDVLLFEYAKDEDGLKAMYAGVHALINILKTPNMSDNKPEAVEVILPESDTLLEQLKRRTVYNLLVDDDEEEQQQQLTTTYWLSTPMGDDFDHEPELTKCDLIQLVEKFVPGFDLEAELKKGSNMSDTSILSRQIKRITSRKSTDTINTSKMTSGGAAFVAPLRGRGFIRGVMGGGLNRGDMFRSRPPNTSRPPSMHVDDFVKLETQTHHHQPHQPQHQPQQQQNVSNATNAMPMEVGHLTRRSDEMMRLRGDTFDRGVTRFFSSSARWPFHTFSSSASRDDTVLLLRGAYRTVGVMNRPGGLMMRGTATNLNNRTSPTKNMWPIRRSNYSTVAAAFARSGSEVGERRPTAAVGAGVGGGATYAYHPTQNPALVWHEHKDRSHEHRINVPADAFSSWRERMHHPKSIR